MFNRRLIKAYGPTQLIQPIQFHLNSFSLNKTTGNGNAHRSQEDALLASAKTRPSPEAKPTENIPATVQLARAGSQGQTSTLKANVKLTILPLNYMYKEDSPTFAPYELGRFTVYCLPIRPANSWTSTYKRNTEGKIGINRHAGEWIYLLLNWMYRAKRKKHEDVSRQNTPLTSR